MVEEVKNSQVVAQQFSVNGMKLSDIKKDNELLFNFFKNAGYKEDSVIYSSDITKLKEQFDTDQNGNLSLKELKAMLGDEVSRSDRRMARKALEAINSNNLAEDGELLPEQVDETTTNYRNNKGELIYKKTIDDIEGEKKTYYLNGNENRIDKTVTTSTTDDGPITTTTYYLDGDETRIKQQITDDNGDITTTDYNWDANNLFTTNTKHGNDITFTKYKNINGRQVETLVMDQFKSDPSSFVSTENEYNDEGAVVSQTREFYGAKIDNKTRVIKQTVTLKNPIAPEMNITDDNIQSAEVTVLNNKNEKEVQNYANIDGKYQRVEKDTEGNFFVRVKCPAGMSIDELANKFGLTKADILNSNKDTDGKPLWHTNSRGANYFYIDQPVKIVNPTKIPDDLDEERYVWGEEDINNSDQEANSTENENNKLDQKTTRKPDTKHPVNHHNTAAKAASNKTVPNNSGAGNVNSAQKTHPTKVKQKVTHKKYAYVNPDNPSARAVTHYPGPKPAVLHAKMRYSQQKKYGRTTVNSSNIDNTLRAYYNNSPSGQTLVSALLHEYSRNKNLISEEDIRKDLQYLKRNIIYCDSNYKENLRDNTLIPTQLYSFVPSPKASPEQTVAEAKLYEEVFGRGTSGIDLT